MAGKTTIKWIQEGTQVYVSGCGRFRIFRPHYQGGKWALYDVGQGGENSRPVAYGTFNAMKAEARKISKNEPLVDEAEDLGLGWPRKY